MSWGFHFISRAGSFEMMAAEREQSGKKEKLRSSVYYYSYDGSQLQRLLTIYKQLWTPPRLLLILHWKPSCKNRKVQSKFQQRVASQIRLLGGKIFGGRFTRDREPKWRSARSLHSSRAWQEIMF